MFCPRATPFDLVLITVGGLFQGKQLLPPRATAVERLILELRLRKYRLSKCTGHARERRSYNIPVTRTVARLPTRVVKTVWVRGSLKVY